MMLLEATAKETSHAKKNRPSLLLCARTPRVVRSSIAECTGKGGIDVEDSLDYCANWKKIPVGLANDAGCLRMPEYE